MATLLSLVIYTRELAAAIDVTVGGAAGRCSPGTASSE